MEKSFFLPFFLLFCLFVGDVVSRAPNRSIDYNKNIDNRIVGGYNITIQEVPYQVLLYLQKGQEFELCGGSIISETYVLTAAHCVREAIIIYVIAGTTLTNSGGTVYNTTLYTEHPLYNPVNSDYDVGLINIPGGITLDGTNTRAVALPDANSTIAPGTNLLITGWGLTTGDSGGPAVATDSGLQVGIISSGGGCGQPGYPGVYIDVASVRTWININAGV